MPSSRLFCRFGGVKSVPAVYIRSTMVRCLSPPLSGTEISLEVSNNGNDFSNSGAILQLHPTIVVKSLSPIRGPLNGDTMVTLEVENVHLTENLSCRFGTTVVNAKLLSGGKISCVTPPSNLIMKVNVEVSFNMYDFSSSGMQYEYTEKMSVLRISPEFGSLDSTAEIQVEGMHFLNNTELHCRFGENVVAAVFVNSALVLCKTPPILDQLLPDNGFAVSVGVTSSGPYDMSSFTDDNIFYTYFNQVNVISMNPESTFVGSQSTVSVYGDFFVETSLLSCYFGVHRVYASYVSSTEIKCDVPALSNGTYSVTISLNGLISGKSTSELNLNVYPSPVIASIYPDRYLVDRKTNVLVKGHNFRRINDGLEAKCHFGPNIESKANIISDAEIACEAPLVEEASVHETQNIKIFSEQQAVEQQVVTSTAGGEMADEVQAVTIVSRGDKPEIQTVQTMSMSTSQEVQTITTTCISRDEQQRFGIEVYPEVWEVQRLTVDAPASTVITGSLVLNVTFPNRRDQYFHIKMPCREPLALLGRGNNNNSAIAILNIIIIFIHTHTHQIYTHIYSIHTYTYTGVQLNNI